MRYKVIIGLGNPGKEYEHTYHNVGLLALERLMERYAENHELSAPDDYKGLFSYMKGEDVLFVRPLLFMNDSGRAVREAVRMAHASPEETLILHDDTDLAVGTFKMTAGQGAAGHHGVESVAASLGSNAFARARIGVRPAREVKERSASRKAGEFVLKPIKKSDAASLDAVFDEIAGAAA